jgi:hypothetical protein
LCSLFSKHDYSKDDLVSRPIPKTIEKKALSVFAPNDRELAKKNSTFVNSVKAWYFCNPVPGGLCVFMNEKGERLISNTDMSFEKHIQDFLDGKRN